jgi:hypothetical protein
MAQLVKPLTKETLVVDRLPTFLLCLVVLSLVPGTAAPGHARDTRVAVWNGIELQAVRDTGMGPPMAARALAMLHTAMFDAWVAYDPVAVGTRLGSSLRRPAEERTVLNKEQAVSYAAYRVLLDLFPSQSAIFQAKMAELGYDPFDTSQDPATPQGIGNRAARALLDYRHQDGSNQLGDLHPGPYSDYTGYAPVNGPDTIFDPNRWQPLRLPDGLGGFTVQTFLAPHWGLVLPFALSSGGQFRPRPPAIYPTDAQGYIKQTTQILDYSAELTDRHKAIAEYWADGPSSETPPGHWALFAQVISRRDGHGLDEDVVLFFALANAVQDAGIAVWDAKRHYDYARPITVVHFLFHDQLIRAWKGPFQGTGLLLGQDWRPYQPATFVTPPFPEYVSGHSAFSAAAATTLRLYTKSPRFGHSATIPAGSSKIEPGAVPAADVVLRWKTFKEAADEAGLSRRYGGIHFEDGDLRGRRLGRQVAKEVWRKVVGHVRRSGWEKSHVPDCDEEDVEDNRQSKGRIDFCR